MTVLFQRIKLICTQRNITQYRIEKGANLTIGSLTKWDHSMPSGDKILRVANFLDVSVDYLLGNTDNPQSHKSTEEFSVIAEEMGNAISRLTSEISEIMEAHKLRSTAQQEPPEINN